jgi:hypothetical protein
LSHFVISTIAPWLCDDASRSLSEIEFVPCQIRRLARGGGAAAGECSGGEGAISDT